MLALATAANAAPYAGRTVQDVLHELGQSGLNFIYNTQQLPETLTVTAEPSATTPLDMAREILAAHGLALMILSLLQ